MGRIRTRNLRAKAAPAKAAMRRRLAMARQLKGTCVTIHGLAEMSAKLAGAVARMSQAARDVIAAVPAGGSFPVFPKLPAALPRGEFVMPHRPFLTPAMEDTTVNVRDEITRQVQDALARGETVNLTLDGRVIATYPPHRG